MSRYRRIGIPGASCFFTVALAERGGSVLTDRIDLLRAAWRVTVAERPVFCDAMVVLPDHLHAVWTPPEGDADHSGRWRLIKARYSRGLGEHRPRSDSKIAKRECGLWQRRFREHAIRGERGYRAHVDYCWRNPVKHGLVSRAVDWPFSSIHRDIRAGRVPPEWASATASGDVGALGG